MRTNTLSRLKAGGIVLLTALASLFLNHNHAVAQSVAASASDLPVCDRARLEGEYLPIIDATDLVAEQLRNTIASTSEPVLRSKLRQAYLRYLGCLKPNGETAAPQDRSSEDSGP